MDPRVELALEQRSKSLQFLGYQKVVGIRVAKVREFGRDAAFIPKSGNACSY